MKKVIVLFLGIISILICIIWFSDKKMIASGEEGVLYYLPSAVLNIYKTSWYQTGTGFLMPVIIPRITHLYAILFLNIFLPNWFTEALIFTSLLSAGMVGMYLFTKEIGLTRKTSIISALLYLFNTFTVFYIWDRSLYVGYFGWSYFPIFLYFLANILKHINVKNLLFFAFFNILFSNSYGQPAYLFVVWSTASLFLVGTIVNDVRNRRAIITSISRFMLFVIVWVISSLWWLYPLVTLSTDSFSTLIDWKSNYDSMRAVSSYYTNIDLLRLSHRNHTGSQSEFFSFYDIPVIGMIFVLILGLMIFGVIQAKKEKAYWFLLSTLILGFIVCKGAHPPYGLELFEYLFRNYSFTQTLRNPYEKFGLVFMMPYVIFVSYALSKVKSKLILIMLLIIIVIPVYPLYSGKIYNGSKFNVPLEYRELNTYLNIINDDSRVLMFPTIYGDGIAYNWGYAGIEPSEFIFDREFVSKVLRTKYFDDKYKILTESITDKDQDQFYKLLDQMDIGYLLVDSSIVQIGQDSDTSMEFMSSLDQIGELTSYGHLKLYSYRSNIQNDRIVQIYNGTQRPLEYKKLSSTKYLVTILETDSSSQVVFRSTFNNNWKLVIDDRIEPRHLLYEDLSNSWTIAPIPKDTEAYIIFKVWPWE